MKTIRIGLVLSLVLFSTAHAQTDSEEFARIRKSLKDKITKQMPGWKHRTIEPIEGSSGVIIQQWESGNIVVKIALSQYSSEAGAERAFKGVKSQIRTEEEATTKNRKKAFHLIKEELTNLGDEGFTVDVRGSEAVTFRKGAFIVNVSIVQPEQSNDIYFSRKFAEFAASALEPQPQ